MACNPVRPVPRPWRRATAIPMLVVTLLAGCASVPPPDAALARAQARLQAAREAGAADYDPVDLDFAQARYDAAQAAVAAGKNAPAAALAEESLADGQLALTKSKLAALRSQIQAKTRENTRLREQLLDKPASPAPSAPSTQELPEQVLPMPAAASSSPAPAAPMPEDGQ